MCQALALIHFSDVLHTLAGEWPQPGLSGSSIFTIWYITVNFSYCDNYPLNYFVKRFGQFATMERWGLEISRLFEMSNDCLVVIYGDVARCSSFLQFNSCFPWRRFDKLWLFSRHSLLVRSLSSPFGWGVGGWAAPSRLLFWCALLFEKG